MRIRDKPDTCAICGKKIRFGEIIHFHYSRPKNVGVIVCIGCKPELEKREGIVCELK